MRENKTKIIISDNSALSGLTSIGKLDLLRKVYNSVTVTKEVKEEYENMGMHLTDTLPYKTFLHYQHSHIFCAFFLILYFHLSLILFKMTIHQTIPA